MGKKKKGKKKEREEERPAARSGPVSRKVRTQCPINAQKHRYSLRTAFSRTLLIFPSSPSSS